MGYRKEYLEMATKIFWVQENADKATYLDLAENLLGYLLSTLKLKSLYKYWSFEKWNRDKSLLQEDKLYLPTMDVLNDPFEFAMAFNYDDFIETVIEKHSLQNKTKDELSNMFRDKFEDIINQINNTKQKMGVRCFSETNDNLLMWAHYADSHKGYCVEYSSIDLFNQFQTALVPVVYKIDYPKVGYFNDSLGVYENAMSRIATKSIVWEYENEWRVVRMIHEEGDKIAKSIPPKAIILGCNTKEQYEKEALELCKGKSISLYKMKCSPTSYKLIPDIIYEEKR